MLVSLGQSLHLEFGGNVVCVLHRLFAHKVQPRLLVKSTFHGVVIGTHVVLVSHVCVLD